MTNRKRRAGISICVNEYSASWLKKGFDWVYPKEISKKPPHAKNGSLVSIYSKQNEFLGIGIYSFGRVAVRRFRTTQGDLDEEFFVQRLQEALQIRQAFTAQMAWRWVHAENDFLPGIRIDVWGRQLTITLSCSSLQTVLPNLLKAISVVTEVQSVWGYIRDEKMKPLGLLQGSAPTEDVIVTEGKCRYLIQLDRSPDCGVFSDMRDLRRWLQPFFAQKTVLNLFCFTGAFSVSAACAGARKTVSVDISPTYIDWTKKNFLLNSLDVDSHEFVIADGLKALDRFRRKNKRFDIVIADPPSFSHGPSGQWSVQRNLTALVASCLRVLSPGGLLVIATNYGKMSPKEFTKAVRDGSDRVKRSLRILHQYHPPIDFPSALAFPESRYLKCWVLQG